MSPRFNTVSRAGASRLSASRGARHALISWLFLLLTVLWTITAHTTPTKSPNSQTETPLPHLGSTPVNSAEATQQARQTAALIQQAATTLAAPQPQQQAQAQLATAASQAINQGCECWLGQLGHVRATLDVDHRFKNLRGGLALWMPIDEATTRPLTFGQLGFHHHDRQPVANFGLGQRYQLAEWLLGYNAFLDHNLRHAHTRWSLGAEAWRADLLLSANGYFPISDWKISKALTGYEEKPARGFDVRAQFYWPSYRHIGGKLLYERYQGDEVGLFGKAQRQKNPSALTVGLDYTPVPLLTVGVDHQIGREQQRDTRFKLQLDYAFCSPLDHQLDPTRVAAQRSLHANRAQWVQRNEQLVMQYQRLPAITLLLPATLSGKKGESKELYATVTATHGFQQIEWEDTSLRAAGGKLDHIAETRYRVTLPTTAGRYTITGVAIDKQGRRSQSATTTVIVEAANPGTISLTLSHTELKGAASEKLIITAKVASGFTHIEWYEDATRHTFSSLVKALDAEGKPSPEKRYQVTLPDNDCQLTAIAFDEYNNQSESVKLMLIIDHDKLTIKPANGAQLPTIWLAGDTLQLVVNGGTPGYTWKSEKGGATVDDNGLVTLTKNAHQGDIITVTDDKQQSATFELPAQASLVIQDDTARNYAKSEAYCKDINAKLVDRRLIEPEKVRIISWAKNTINPSVKGLWADSADSNQPDVGIYLNFDQGKILYDANRDMELHVVCLFENSAS